MPDELIADENRPIEIPEKPVQFDTPQLTVADVEVDSLIRVNRARDSFQVNGNGLTVAVLDTGFLNKPGYEGRRDIAQIVFDTIKNGKPVKNRNK
ncbi:MAG: hypothetical protein WA584_14740 [Pyrinomonadaceae bacterium]